MVENSTPSIGFFAWPAPPDASSAVLDVSIVAPMHNEAGGAAALIGEIAVAFEGMRFEIVLVDDASTDSTLHVLKEARKSFPQLRVLHHRKQAGQSRALRSAVLAARAPVIAMLDGDGQNNPADLPGLLKKLQDGGSALAMVGGERENRQDSAAKKWASGAANAIRGRALNDGAVDTGCGLKVFYREAFLRLPYFDHMHRYLPALMRREGYGVSFHPVSHRPRAHGVSKYTNIGRFLVAIRDLLGVLWLLGRSRSPEGIDEITD